MVGTSGSRLERVELVTASARSFPAATLLCEAGIGANAIGMCPPSRSVSAGPVPL
ncbi:MAG: hypothetical protein Q7U92_26695 [Bradyrhizobium sp.]|nr:hypothetical protein [Bradyrhizobium sp.]